MINNLEDLKVGMKFKAQDQNCVEFAGADAEDKDGNQLAMFELFCSGRMVVCKVEDAIGLMNDQKFEKITEAEWMKRVVAVAEFGEDRSKYKTYLERFDEMDYTEKEIEKMYETMLEG